MSEMVDTSMQKVGMREDNEKKTYDSYISRERRYEQRYQRVQGGWISGVRTMKISKSTQVKRTRNHMSQAIPKPHAALLIETAA